ncbi:MAG: permease [Elusimicrobiota bacterium]
MLIPTIIFFILAVVLLYYGHARGQGEHIVGLKAAAQLLWQIIPLLLCAFIVAGMVQTMLPHDKVAHWVGQDSGLRGIMIGACAGALTPGGPFVSMPLAAGFYHSGASAGTVVAYLTGWSVWGLTRIPLEVAILGWRLALIRMASCLLLPPLAGGIAYVLFRRF